VFVGFVSTPVPKVPHAVPLVAKLTESLGTFPLPFVTCAVITDVAVPSAGMLVGVAVAAIAVATPLEVCVIVVDALAALAYVSGVDDVSENVMLQKP
jgi:hypothetical protein